MSRRIIVRAAGAVTALLLTYALLGCFRSPEKSDEDPLHHLPVLDQAPLIEAELLKAARSNARKSCPRPVLRGESLGGKAAPEILAVLEGAPEDASCRKLLQRHDEDFHDALFFSKDDPAAGYPQRRLRTALPLGDPRSRLAGIGPVIAECAPAIERSRRATRRKDACSPYLPGVHCPAEDYMSLLRLSYAAVATARAQLEAGEQRAAFEILSDQIRFAQDFHRGGTSWIEAMLGTMVINRAAAMIELMLNRPDPIGEDLLRQMDSELDGLIRSEPHPGESLLGDQLSLAIYMLMPTVHGPNWNPPGGWQDNCERTSELKSTELESAIAWVAVHRLILMFRRACPDSVTPHECAERFARESQQLVDEFADQTILTRLARALLASDKEDEMARQAVEVIENIGVAAHEKYIRRLGQNPIHLAALRLHARYRLLAEQQGSCPGPDAFDAPPLSDVRTETYSGGELRVEQLGEDRFAVRAPVEVEKTFDEDQQLVIVIECSIGAGEPKGDGGV